MVRRGGDGDGDGKRVLLRVIGPPYYTLLRRPQFVHHGGRPRYVERRGRVGRVGHTLPLAHQLRGRRATPPDPPPRSGSTWTTPRSRTFTTSCSSSCPRRGRLGRAKSPKMTVPVRLTDGANLFRKTK